MAKPKPSREQSISRWYPLRDHPVQLALVDDDVRFKVAPAGRRCLVKGTLVTTTSGPRPIETLQQGDLVVGYSETYDKETFTQALPTRVVETHCNGLQEVFEVWSRGRHPKLLLTATEGHRLLTERGLVAVRDQTKNDHVELEYAPWSAYTGGVEVPTAYALGALLGDGCGKYRSLSTLSISAADERVPEAVAEVLGCSVTKSTGGNWTLGAPPDAVAYYTEWAKGRRAHEKTADWGVVDTWSYASALELLAGLVDTDGSVYRRTRGGSLRLGLGMQAKDVVEVASRILWKYFQVDATVRMEKRAKQYVNGPMWLLLVSGPRAVRVIEELMPWSFKCSSVAAHGGVSLTKGQLRGPRVMVRPAGVQETFDITVDNEGSLYLLHSGVVTHNSGKSERAKRFFAKQPMVRAGAYLIAAPTHQQVKRLYWEDMKKLSFCGSIPGFDVNETDMILTYPNGGSIHLLGMDNPERAEGTPWLGILLDEFGSMKEDVWKYNLRPALSTQSPEFPGFKPFAWLIGTPEGLNHYYDISEYARTSGDPEWKNYTWKSSEILTADEIEAVRKTMSPREFKQEYEGSFETAQGRIYDDYGDANVEVVEARPDEPLHWMHDFNYAPMSSAVAVVRGDNIFVVDEIVLDSANSRMVATEFAERYLNHVNKNVILYGDPSGNVGAKHGLSSNYIEMETLLRDVGWSVQRRVRNKAPAIRDRQNALRARILNAAGERHLKVNAPRAKILHKGLSTVQYKEGSVYLEQETRYQHITTAVGYCVEFLWPIRRDIDTESTPLAKVHYWR